MSKHRPWPTEKCLINGSKTHNNSKSWTCMVHVSETYYPILAEQILEQSTIPFRFVNYGAAPIQKFFWNSIPRHLAFVPGISNCFRGSNFNGLFLRNPPSFWEVLLLNAPFNFILQLMKLSRHISPPHFFYSSFFSCLWVIRSRKLLPLGMKGNKYDDKNTKRPNRRNLQSPEKPISQN